MLMVSRVDGFGMMKRTRGVRMSKEKDGNY